MNRVMIGLIAGVLAISLFATGMIASTMEPESSAPITQVAIANPVDSSGMGVAIFSILLGSGMVFIFRPKQRIYVKA